MEIEVVTKEDLQKFRLQLLDDIRQMLYTETHKPIKPWLKNSEVRKLLSISANTVQRLRIGGKLRSTKIGGIHYYKYEDIERLLNSNTA